jgi:hypothetical protein
LNTQDITLCLTIGKRPELLRQTLNSLLSKAQFKQIIAINDFRDEETNLVFKELCPEGLLISLQNQVGHHKAVDEMYSKVETAYIFHCEDDWYFDQSFDFEKYIKILSQNKNATQLCFRKINDFPFSEDEKSKIQYIKSEPVNLVRLDSLHDQWHGYTFNPHLASTELWKSFPKGFSEFKKERHISRQLRAKNLYTLFLEDGICHHIGDDNSVANASKKSWFAKWKGKIFG